jgi:23S rRNA (cytidine1920-2'-O)/16S rRNA (cytidine1409-2'-O)-methyltransferase
MIMAGFVEVNGAREDKSGKSFLPDVNIRIVGQPLPFVSRGGLKLEAALDHFAVHVENRVALDVGASTGGFSDCLLQRGVRRIYAVDVGYGQLHMKIRKDPRVVVMDRRNIRHMAPSEFDPLPNLAVMDVSFISLRIVVPVVERILKGPKEIVALVKPQFEVGKREVGKGGVVKDPVLHRRVLKNIDEVGRNLGLNSQAPYPSPILGAKGNQEFFMHFSGE